MVRIESLVFSALAFFVSADVSSIGIVEPDCVTGDDADDELSGLSQVKPSQVFVNFGAANSMDEAKSVGDAKSLDDTDQCTGAYCGTVEAFAQAFD